MSRYGIPTAKGKSFQGEEWAAACAYLSESSPPYVLKADGLAGGKGVLILSDRDEAKAALSRMLRGEMFGGNKVVIEEYLQGQELSCFILCNETSDVYIGDACDYKKVGEGDVGANTGGMGAISPACSDEILSKIKKKIIIPTLRGLREEGMAYKGFLFFGLMLVKGEPYVLEYNVRLGDPETQVILPRIDNDFLALLEGVFSGKIKDQSVRFSDQSAAVVSLVAKGYPFAYEKEIALGSLTDLGQIEKHSLLFHAGTKVDAQGRVWSDGGRVLSVLATHAESTKEAARRCYDRIEGISCAKKLYYRKDIGAER